jgi:hypothetical protein
MLIIFRTIYYLYLQFFVQLTGCTCRTQFVQLTTWFFGQLTRPHWDATLSTIISAILRTSSEFLDALKPTKMSANIENIFLYVRKKEILFWRENSGEEKERIREGGRESTTKEKLVFSPPLLNRPCRQCALGGAGGL